MPIGLFTFSRLNKNYYDENSAILAGFSEIAGTGVTLAIKNLFKRERPFRELKYVYYDDKNSPTDRYAFPSNHTTATFAMATALTLRYPNKPFLIAGSYLYASIVGFGRMYLGVHYPADVLGGILVGSGGAVIIYSLRKQIITFKNNLFKEKGNQDKNENSQSTSLVLISLVGSDLINFVLSGSHVSNKLQVNFNANEQFNVQYNF
jgi:membrane-associated phospholipid phosphatase